MAADHFYLSKLKPHRDDECNPEDATEQAVDEELAIAHPRHAGDERRTGSDDRHKAGIDDRPRPVLLVELLRPFQMIRMEELRFRPAENSGTSLTAEIVAQIISDNRGHHQKCGDDVDIERRRTGGHANTEE